MPAPGQDLDQPPQFAQLLFQANNRVWALTFPVQPDCSVDPADLGAMLRALADAVDPPRVDEVGRYMRDHHVGFPEAVEALARERGLMPKTGQPSRRPQADGCRGSVVPLVPRVPPDEAG